MSTPSAGQNVTALYTYPVLTAQPAGTEYNPALPNKFWAAPLGVNDPNSLFQASGYDNSANPSPIFTSWAMAAEANVPPAGTPGIPPEFAVPCNPVPAGLKLVPGPLGTLPMLVPVDPATTLQATVNEILAIVQAIQTKVGA